MRKVYKNNSCLIVLTHPPYFRETTLAMKTFLRTILDSKCNSVGFARYSQSLAKFKKSLFRGTRLNDRNFLRSIRDNTVPRREFRGSAVVMRVSEADWRTHETSSRNWRRLIAASYRDSLSTSARSTGSVLLAAPLQSPPRRDYRK